MEGFTVVKNINELVGLVVNVEGYGIGRIVEVILAWDYPLVILFPEGEGYFKFNQVKEVVA